MQYIIHSSYYLHLSHRYLSNISSNTSYLHDVQVRRTSPYQSSQLHNNIMVEYTLNTKRYERFPRHRHGLESELCFFYRSQWSLRSLRPTQTNIRGSRPAHNDYIALLLKPKIFVRIEPLVKIKKEKRKKKKLYISSVIQSSQLHRYTRFVKR